MRKSTRTQSLFMEDVRLCCYPNGTTLVTTSIFYNRRMMAGMWIITTILLILSIVFILNHILEGGGTVATRFIHFVFRVAMVLKDCPIGSVMYCPENKVCISDSQRCDRFQDCPDDRDEINCTCRHLEYKCTNGRCISDRFLCDGVQDCPLNDDENNEFCGSCSGNKIRCKKTKKCIEKRNICDGRVDCPGNDDEQKCAEILKSSELTLTYRGENNYYVCASNWVYEMASNICRYLGYKTVFTFWKYKLKHGKFVTIHGLHYYKHLIVINSVRTTKCKDDESIKLECSSGACGRRKYSQKSSQYIINGVATDPRQWPWHARFSCDGGTCGSSILSEFWVITAAHCLYNKSGIMHSPKSCIVAVGSTNIFGKWTVHKIQHVVIHKDYVHRLIVNDVALVKVSTRIIFNSFVQPICLPENRTKVFDFRVCVGIGFGKTLRGKLSTALLQSKMMEYERTFCSPGRRKASSEICIGTRPGLGNVNICMGDSGGSFSCQRPNEDRWVLMGVFSYVSAKIYQKEEHLLCQASIASRVTYFTQWIEMTINKS